MTTKMFMQAVAILLAVPAALVLLGDWLIRRQK